LLASGNIPYPDETDKPAGKLAEIYNFCSYLDQHDFWGDQVVQIYVNKMGEYELIPRVGAHQILLGSMDQWERKLRNLELLYTQGFPRYGWNTYGIINLKYTILVICTKR
jgi:cell division protein FtsQ